MVGKSKKPKKLRIDKRIIELGLVADLSEAHALIMAGQVLVGEQKIDKVGHMVKDGEPIRLKDQKRFVSRGGDKLWGAVEDLGIEELFRDAVVLDCGASTGGFTDCALQLGAKKVYALDVGYNQLAWKLRQDPRVVVMERCDIRDCQTVIDPLISLALADISFNSLDRLLPALRQALPQQEVSYLLLVKPQFELQREHIPEGGVVDRPEDHQQALGIAQQAISREGLQCLQQCPSRLKGREGNQEFFLLAQAKPSS